MERNITATVVDGDISSGKNTCFERKVENGQNVEEATISDQKKGLNITDADISSARNICLEENETEQDVQITLSHESQRKWSNKRHCSTSIADIKCDPGDISSAATILNATSHDMPKDGCGASLTKEFLDSENGSGVTDIKVSAKMSQSIACSEEEQTSGSSFLLGKSRVSSEQKNVKLKSVIVKAAGHSRRKLLILDVNGLLADILPYYAEGYEPDIWISRKAVFKRPFCDDFLQFCFETFDVGVWSSRNRKNVESVVDFLMGDKKIKLLFCWDQDHCTDTGYNTVGNRSKPLFLKEIKKLWNKEEPHLPWEKGDYNESNTLLIDDSPYKALRNPPYTGIFPHPFTYKDITDNSLGPDGNLRLYLQRLAEVDDVQKFVRENPIGQRPITKSNSSWSSWNFYSKIINATSSSEPEKKGDDRSGETGKWRQTAR